MTSRAASRELLTVVAYDVRDDRRRVRLVNVLRDYGRRIQYSVFECELTDRRLEALRARIERVIVPAVDRVVFYRLCDGCRDRAEHCPPNRRPSWPPVLVLE